jgi:hypothetical protein
VNLLNIVRTDSFGPRKGSVPLLVEFRVNPETAPFLVSSTRSFVWVTPRQDRLRAAIRPLEDGGIEGVFRHLVMTIADTGADGKWGSIHPYTPAGLASARAHLSYYDLKETDVFAHPDTDVIPLGMDVCVRAKWVPEGWAVVLPTDREFVGFVVMSGDRYLVVVHNSSRAVAVVRP